MAFATMPFYNIDQPVGPGQPNRTDDVRLVQTMLKEISLCSQTKFAPSTPIPTSGSFDATTAAWILAYQTAVAKVNPGKLTADGKISPMPMRNAYDVETTYGGKFYTLFVMNVNLRNRNKKAHADLPDKLGLQEKRPPGGAS